MCYERPRRNYERKRSRYGNYIFIMQYIFHNERLEITFNPLKHRLYCTMRGFWQYDEDKAAFESSIFQQLTQRQDIHTIVLDTSAVILRMQFGRVLKDVQRAHEVRHDTFQQQQGAELWLDSMQSDITQPTPSRFVGNFLSEVNEIA